MNKDILHFKHLLDEIEKTVNWGKVESWNEARYEELSKQIHQKTGIIISPFVLYEIFFLKKKNINNTLPLKDIRDTLAQFLNHKNWEQFVESLKTRKSNKSFRSMLAGLVLLSFCIVCLIAYEHRASLEVTDFRFEFHKSTNTTIPYTATFLYDISKIENEVYIDFGLINFDSREKQVMSILNPNDTIIQFTYTRNGVYHPRLFIKNSDQTLKQLNINLTSDYWNVFAYQNGKCEELEFLDSRKEEYLSVQNSDIVAHGLNTAKEFKTLYTLCKDYDIELDRNFNLEFKFKSTSTQYLTNKYFQVELECDQLVQLSFSNDQNIESSNIRMADFYAKSKPIEMKGVNVDFNQWHLMRIHLNEGELEVYIDNQELFRHHYTQGLGTLREIRFEFSGNGSIKDVTY